jgi:23S rRNA (adenine2503-C2)-methyltransferase
MSGIPEWSPKHLRLLLDLPASRWREVIAEVADAGYRADQVANWVFRQGTYEFASMLNLPVDLRSKLALRYSVEPPVIDKTFESTDGTKRHLMRLADGLRVEAVAMPYEDRVTLCLSSQVGCRYACSFCQTGAMGLARSLSSGEIIGQALRLRTEMGDPRLPVNLVFMGQGEPLDNAAAVRRAIEGFQDPLGPAMSWRRMTVSTVGVVPEIRRLAALGERRPRLAISLNATTDEVRSKIMPVNRKWPIAELLACVRTLRWRPRERVTFEYVLLAGINDTPADARRLAELLRGLPAKVNLIPWNELPGMAFERPSPQAIERFRLQVLKGGLDALVRYSRGTDIAAACGQLHAAAARSGQSGSSNGRGESSD